MLKYISLIFYILVYGRKEKRAISIYKDLLIILTPFCVRIRRDIRGGEVIGLNFYQRQQNI